MSKQNKDNKIFPAHIKNGEIQSCIDHCLATAEYAKKDLQSSGLGNVAYMAGVLHDCGKFSKEFAEYISKAASGEKVTKGSVVHSFAGVYYILNKYHGKGADPYQALTAEIIAYGIGAHHGLFDCIGDSHENGFEHRLTKQPDYEKRAIDNFFDCLGGDQKLEEVFQDASQEITEAFKKILSVANQTDNRRYNIEILFCLGLLARLTCSAVIDGDRRDAAEFMSNQDFSRCIQATDEIWETCSSHLEDMLNGFSSDSNIQKARREISDICLAFSEEPTGIYRLNVPTGGGKTLSSLRFALAHAKKFGKKRIIYTAPLISILDQNAAVIRTAIKDDSLILEHHSNVVRDKESNKEETSIYDLLTETWDSPIIITTLVQLLNTFFSGKSSCVRRFHSLCDSIIIIDEVQTVPEHMLSLFNLTLNFISKICNATVILCSATQPCLEEIPHGLNISEKTFISPKDYARFSKIFKRTKLVDKGSLQFDEISGLIDECMKEVKNLLTICNTKREAADLFKQTRVTHKNCYHLSASMCMAHRKDVLEEIYASLESGKETICISTKVIEAGVDISFERAIRIIAGMDSVVQSAGRCNRNGEMPGIAEVYIVRCLNERLGGLESIKCAQNATNNLLTHYKTDPERFEEDLASDESVDFYYRSLYRSLSDSHYDYPIIGKPSLLEMLSDNSSYADGCKEVDQYSLRQAFKTAGELFKALDQDNISVIVPYGEGKNLIAELCSERAKYDISYLKSLIEQAKDYTVSVYQNQFDRMQQTGAFYSVCDGTVTILKEAWYDNSLGLREEPVEKEEEKCSILIL